MTNAENSRCPSHIKSIFFYYVYIYLSKTTVCCKLRSSFNLYTHQIEVLNLVAARRVSKPIEMLIFYYTKRCKEHGARLFPVLPSNRTRGNPLCVSLLEQGVWTRWPPGVPSNLNSPAILWSEVTFNPVWKDAP